MTPQQSDPIISAVLEIMRTCIELRAVGVDAFCEYVPHVDELVVRVYPEGWQRDTDSIRLDVYLDLRTDYVLYKLNSIQAYLLNLFPTNTKEVSPCP